jgi:hypothetical protein
MAMARTLTDLEVMGFGTLEADERKLQFDLTKEARSVDC